MSVVIAAKYRDGVVIASDRQVTSGTLKHNNATKIHKFKYSNSAIGVVGYLRDCNLMRVMEEIVPYKDILDKISITEDYVTRVFVPAIYNYMNTNHRINTGEENGTMNSIMLYATKDRIFEIGEDFSVIENEDSYLTIGCGNTKIIGYMASIGDTSHYSKKDITVLLENAIKRACDKDAFINDKIDFVYIN